ncbi:myosin family protein with Dil domain [Striga asiatica]|uniref:Myosin family protein with Dil domain n=1 Tax=Striga asiatica TaxID=4170 RepID=A0A5A7P0R7_STRAF|nr:myosin family protein with Dil domain [Striga asiatica]
MASASSTLPEFPSSFTTATTVLVFGLSPFPCIIPRKYMDRSMSPALANPKIISLNNLVSNSILLDSISPYNLSSMETSMGVDKDGVEQLVREAEVVALEPEGGRDGAVGLGEAELRRVEGGGRVRPGRVGWFVAGGEEIEERCEVVVGVGEPSDVVGILLVSVDGGREGEVMVGGGGGKEVAAVAVAGEGRRAGDVGAEVEVWRRE